MDAAVQGGAGDKRTTRGRKNNQGDEAIIKEKPLKDNLRDACTLAEKKAEAGRKFNDKIKAIAEQSGMQSSVVRRAVLAKHGDKFENAKRDAEQMVIALDAVEPESAK